mmetsp:Transcript_25652/g.66030  ORF Transcript_25652/g.66030 Transcript_25652/m.66030 type:complete len:325 (-) Transcript_25652:1073-2047(-)
MAPHLATSSRSCAEEATGFANGDSLSISSSSSCCFFSSSAGSMSPALPSSESAALGTTYATSRFSPSVETPTFRASTTTCATRGCVPSAASTSPSSMRKPRTLTWWSSRPRHSRMPSLRQRHKSPVRYMRPLFLNGLATNLSAVRSGRSRYPGDTPSPAMYSSPGMPTGSGLRLASSTYTCVLAMGLPMWTVSVPCLRQAAVDHTVVSVGPYTFHSSFRRCGSRPRMRSIGSASPPQRPRRLWGFPGHPAAMRLRHVAGVACMSVAPLASSRSASMLASAAWSREAITSVAPALSGMNSSSPAMSKQTVVMATRTSLALTFSWR